MSRGFPPIDLRFVREPGRCHGAGSSGSPHKLNKCDCSAERHDAVANALETCGSAITHAEGHPINHAPKSGFKCRGEFGMSGEDCFPSRIGWARGE